MSLETDLQTLYTARTNLIASMSSGETAVLEFEIRGKRSKFESPSVMLETLNKMIRTLETEIGYSTGRGSARNRARTNR